MTKSVDIERFRVLADAYGANLSRWPHAEQEEAVRLAATPDGEAILQEAVSLDAVLDRWIVANPPTSLIERSIVSGSRIGTGAFRRLQIWWAAIGVIAALSGAAAGSLGASLITSDDPHGYSVTLFGDVSDQED